MTDEYKNKLVALAKELKGYRDTTECKDITFLSKLDYLLGYITALEDQSV